MRPVFGEIPLRDPVQVDGKAMVVFSPSEVGTLSAPFAWTLIGKFAMSRPTLMQIWNTLKRVRSFSKEISVSAIDSQYVFIRFQCREDFVKAYIKREWRVGGKVMHVSRWSPRFTPGVESTCIPVWIEFPRLRAHLQSPGALQSIVGVIGKFLCVDNNVAQFTRLGTTRVCVEIDLSKPIPKSVWINNGGEIFAQQWIFRRTPSLLSVRNVCMLATWYLVVLAPPDQWVKVYPPRSGLRKHSLATKLVVNPVMGGLTLRSLSLRRRTRNQTRKLLLI